MSRSASVDPVLNMSVDSALQECDSWQRLGRERPEGNLSVVSSERASLLGRQQQPLDLQLKACVRCTTQSCVFLFVSLQDK